MDKMISVVTICYNAADVLPFTMESVLAQDLKGFEYVIQDGGSEDATSSVVENYRERFASKDIHLIYNSGPARTLTTLSLFDFDK